MSRDEYMLVLDFLLDRKREVDKASREGAHKDHEYKVLDGRRECIKWLQDKLLADYETYRQ